MPTLDELKLLQALPLELKIAKTKARIKDWVDFYGVDGVYVSFSGGKDSTVCTLQGQCTQTLKPSFPIQA